MTYNDFMTIAETHYTKHCEERSHWERIATAEYTDDSTKRRARAFANAQFECMLAVEDMVSDTFPRKANESASRLLDILCDVRQRERGRLREVA